MNDPSAEQLKVIGAPLAPLSVIACAGSGKTYTAVRRLAQMRERLGASRGRVALLSFSNVAVETFRREYRGLVHESDTSVVYDRVEIDTLDSFITGNVLRPHAHRTMGSPQAAFLVMGTEAFLQGFKFTTNTFPMDITDMQVGVEDGKLAYTYSQNDTSYELNAAYASGLIEKLGRIGAYTHNLGRYWCYRTLLDQPKILQAFARRYPHILIDEAQDIGSVHQAIIEQLIGAGCQVSLIGDPNQGIYGFAGANGEFLRQYEHRAGVKGLQLTKNYRSVRPILDVANHLSVRHDEPDRGAPATPHGAFFVAYRKANRDHLIAAFQTALQAAELSSARSAVLCRARDMASKLAGNHGAPGQGTVKGLAQAAILRDRSKDYLGAFKLVASCVLGLLAAPPQGLLGRLTQTARSPEERGLRRLLWAFTRNPATGLPDATLVADSQWHPLLLVRTKMLLSTIEREHGLAASGNLGNKLAKRALDATPLVAAADLATVDGPPRLRIDTVHQAKGESLDAVLYMANKDHVEALLAGVDTEVGRIGYVAVTRARNLFWLAVPANALNELRPALTACGLQELGLKAPA